VVGERTHASLREVDKKTYGALTCPQVWYDQLSWSGGESRALEHRPPVVFIPAS